MGLTIDAVARRYSTLPSIMLGIHPQDGRGLLLNIELARAGSEEDQKQKTVQGQYAAKKRRWPQEHIDELKATGQWR